MSALATLRAAGRRSSSLVRASAAAALLLGLLAGRAGAQVGRSDQFSIPVDVVSPRLDGAGRPSVAFTRELSARNAAWVQVAFGAYDLGAHSYVTLRSGRDGAVQRLDAAAMKQWAGYSAVFNGGDVVLELHVDPRDRGVFVSVERLSAGGPIDPGLQNLCGADSRAAVDDDRVARFRNGGSFCTAFGIVNGAFVTAGHCADFEPDGILDLGGVLEFNVPASTPDGFVVAAAPEDQYPVLVAGARYRNQGAGDDWCVFRVGPNSNTGLLPHQAYPVFPVRITRESPLPGADVSIVGCGSDFTPFGTSGSYNADNYALQSDVGPYLREVGAGSNVRQEYQTDTTQGNSGSPAFWVAEDLAIAVHTTADCTPTAGNLGTSFENDLFEAAVQEFLGPVVRYVDFGTPLWLPQTGTVLEPFDTVLEGANALPAGGVLSATPASYAVPAGTIVDRAMTIVAPIGVVTITGD